VTGEPSRARLLDARVIGPGIASFALLLGLFLQGAFQEPHFAIIPAGFIFMGFVLVCIAQALRRRLVIRRAPAEAPMLAWLAVAALSLAVASYRRPGVLALVNLTAFVALYFTCTQSLNRRNIRPLLAAFAGALAAALLMGVAQDLYIFDEMLRNIEKNPDWIQTNLPGATLSPTYSGDLITRLKSREVFSFFVISNTFAGLLLLAIPVLLGGAVDIVRGRRNALRWAAAGPAALAVAGFVLLTKTHSKGAWLIGAGVIVGWLAWAASARVASRKPLLAVRITAVAILALGIFLGWPFLIDALGVRTGFYLTALKIWRAHPLLGVGIGNFTEHYFLLKPPWTHEVRNAHSLLLGSLAETGILGAVACAASCLCMIWGAASGKPSGEKVRSPSRASTVACAIGGLAAILTGYALKIYTWPVLLGCGAAFAAVYACMLALPPGRATRIGLTAGLAGLLAHAMADLDFSVGAITYFAAVAAAAGALLSGKARASREIEVKGAYQKLLILAPTAAFLVFVLVVARPLSKSSAFFAQARQSKAPGRRDSLLAKAVEADPSFAEAHLERAMLAGERFATTGATSDLAAAERHFLKAAELRPLSSTIHRRWAHMFERRIQTAGFGFSLANEAVKHYGDAIALYPTNPWLYYYRGKLLEASSTKRSELAEEALRDYLRALELYSEVGNLFLIFEPSVFLDLHGRAVRLARRLGRPEPKRPETRR